MLLIERVAVRLSLMLSTSHSKKANCLAKLSLDTPEGIDIKLFENHVNSRSNLRRFTFPLPCESILATDICRKLLTGYNGSIRLSMDNDSIDSQSVISSGVLLIACNQLKILAPPEAKLPIRIIADEKTVWSGDGISQWPIDENCNLRIDSPPWHLVEFVATKYQNGNPINMIIY